MKKMNMKKAMAVLLLSMFGMLTLSACEKEGPAEQLGEKVDEATKDTQRAVDDATD